GEGDTPRAEFEEAAPHPNSRRKERGEGTGAAQRTAPPSSSRRLRRLQSQPRLDGLAHQEFLDLAGHGHRKRVDEFDIARDLVVGDLPMTEGADLISRQCLAGT